MKKPNIRKDIKEASDVLRDLMQEHLAGIAERMVETIVSRVAKSTPSQLLNAIKDVPTSGVAAYKTELLEAMAVISSDALAQARREVPKAAKIKLGEALESVTLSEFDKLPPSLRQKLQTRSAVLLDTQLADLTKIITFQFLSSADSTDSMSTLSADLTEAAAEYVEGASIVAGSSATASSLINTARNAFFIDSEVQNEIDAFEFMNGDPVSPICQDLAGTIFSADDPEMNRYWPPLHWNCKSWVRPILKGNLGNREIEKLAPSKTAQASIQFSEGKVRCGCGCGLDVVLDEKLLSPSN